MKILRASAHRAMPWKNGGGVTYEIAAFPEGAGLESFGWRVSMARVEADGPFSLFSGIDRTLAVIEGAGLRLDFSGARAAADLSLDSAPFSFPGDAPVSAALDSGAITDLNVMTRRGVFSHDVEVFGGAAEIPLNAAPALRLALVSGGGARLRADGRIETLQDRDCLRLERDESADISLLPGARLYLIRFAAER